MFSEERKTKAKQASREYYHNNKEQRKAKHKEWTDANKDYLRDKQRQDKRKRKQQAIDYLGGSCMKCKNVYHPAVFEFHHRDPSEKADRDPSKMLSLSWVKIEAELNKCDLLCANCHRLAHYEDRY